MNATTVYPSRSFSHPEAPKSKLINHRLLEIACLAKLAQRTASPVLHDQVQALQLPSLPPILSLGSGPKGGQKHSTRAVFTDEMSGTPILGSAPRQCRSYETTGIPRHQSTKAVSVLKEEKRARDATPRKKKKHRERNRDARERETKRRGEAHDEHTSPASSSFHFLPLPDA